MRNIDLTIDENYTLKADASTHDLVVGDTTLQNQALILLSQKGEWKEKPLVGCGIEDMVNDDDTGQWKRRIREELGRDGMKVGTLAIENDNITIDAEYENY